MYPVRCAWVSFGGPHPDRWRSGLLLRRERFDDDQSPAAARTGEHEGTGLFIGTLGEIIVTMIRILFFGPE